MKWIRHALVAVGGALMVYAVVGAVGAQGGRLVGHLAFLAAVLLVHDGLLMPVAIGVGAAIGRFVPGTARTAFQAAALLSATVVVVALPLVLGYGRRPDDPSALPLDYGRGLAIVLAAIWLGAVAVIAVPTIRRRCRNVRP